MSDGILSASLLAEPWRTMGDESVSTGQRPTSMYEWFPHRFSCLISLCFVQLLRATDAKKLRLTRHDDQIYARFRETFPDLKIDVLDENGLKSVEGKAVSEREREPCWWMDIRSSSSNGEHSAKNFNTDRRLQLRNIDSHRCQRRIFQWEHDLR